MPTETIAPSAPRPAGSGEVDAATRRAVLLVTTVGAFLGAFSSSSVNVALPSIGREFGLSAVALNWVATAFLLAAAVALVPAGKIADMRGRKSVLGWGSFVFALASVATGLAWSGGVLIASRIVQGLGAAMVFATSVAILTSAYPPGVRGRVLGINIAATYTGLSLGPVLGGVLTQQAGWRSLFLVNGALGLFVAGAVAIWIRREWAEAGRERFDARGALVLAASLVGLMIGLGRLPSAAGAVLIAAGLAGLAVFVRLELRTPGPLLDISLFRDNAVFAFSNLAALINYSATFAVGFLLSLYLQYIKGLSPQRAGLILVAQPVVMALLSPLMGRLSDRIEPRLLSSAGMGVCAAGLLGLSRIGPATPIGYIQGALAVLGLGFALFSSPNTNAIMCSVPRRSYGVASATLAAMRLTGQMLSMGGALVLFALYVGAAKIGPEVYPRLGGAFRTGFAIFGGLCAAGVFASLARGSIHGGRSGDGKEGGRR